MKKLTANEVETKTKIEEDIADIRGHFDDEELESRIARRANRGEVHAWCTIVVTATWNGYTGTSTLGGVSVEKEAEIAVMANEHGMQAEALADLQKTIEAEYTKLHQFFGGD